MDRAQSCSPRPPSHPLLAPPHPPQPRALPAGICSPRAAIQSSSPSAGNTEGASPGGGAGADRSAPQDALCLDPKVWGARSPQQQQGQLTGRTLQPPDGGRGAGKGSAVSTCLPISVCAQRVPQGTQGRPHTPPDAPQLQEHGGRKERTAAQVPVFLPLRSLEQSPVWVENVAHEAVRITDPTESLRRRLFGDPRAEPTRSAQRPRQGKAPGTGRVPSP